MSTPVQDLESAVAIPPTQVTAEATINTSHPEDEKRKTSVQEELIAPPEIDENEVYNRFTPRRKAIILAVISFCGFLTPLASTAVLIAIPEVAKTLHSTGVIINISNGLFFVFMGLSPMFWGPLAQTSVGRRNIFIASTLLLTAFSAGTALSVNLGMYFAFRMLSAFQGTAILVVGSVVIGDIYKPTERGRAISIFMLGILVGPSVAPLIGGIVITYTSWRVIFWVITALSGAASLMVIFLLPETMAERPETFKGLTLGQSAVKLAQLTNPWKVIQPLLMFPNLWIAALAVSSMIWNQYSLLTPIRYVINPRFNLTTPLQSALFFLPPGLGFLFGILGGGRFSDKIVARYIKKRGRRVPEDRLHAAVWLMAVVIPASMLLYGWSIEKEVGGIPLVVISAFLQGFTQQLALPSINTYLIDVFQDRGMSSVAVAGNYFTRFLFAAGASSACLPAIRVIGIGWFSTISAGFLSAMAALVWLLTRHGEKWRAKKV